MRESMEGPARGSLDDGAPFYFATQEPPSAAAIDDDVYLTVTAATPRFPGQVETIDIILSLDYAMHVVAELSRAVVEAAKSEADRAVSPLTPPAQRSRA
jgi:hypothetical protein